MSKYLHPFLYPYPLVCCEHWMSQAQRQVPTPDTHTQGDITEDQSEPVCPLHVDPISKDIITLT